MSTGDISNKINKLKSIARFGKNPYRNLGPGAFVKTVGSGRNAVTFASVGTLNQFEEIITYLHNKIPAIANNYSLKYFENEIAGFLSLLNKEKRECKINDWNRFIEVLQNKESETIKVLVPIYGVAMNQPKTILGDFTIYHPDNILGLIKKEHPNTFELTNKHIKFDEKYRIGIEITAKDIDKCYESATKAFITFENVANFLTGSFHKTYKIGIYNHALYKQVQTHLIGQKRVGNFRRTTDVYHTVQIDDPKFQGSEFGKDKLWKWITAERNEFQEKILDSVEWCGKALVEPDDSKALLQYIIALEAILHYDEGYFIGPSIVSQLCDMVAFLLGETYKQRQQYSEYVRDLYKIRSSLTHTGKGKLNSISLHTANVICQKIISKIITTPPYSQFQSKKEFCKYLIKLKYGFTENNEK